MIYGGRLSIGDSVSGNATLVSGIDLLRRAYILQNYLSSALDEMRLQSSHEELSKATMLMPNEKSKIIRDYKPPWVLAMVPTSEENGVPK